jgi:hypothetical protein
MTQRIDRFSLLSSAEVALILQSLGNHDRIAAATTCKRMLKDALQAFSWKHAGLLRITEIQIKRFLQGRTSPSLLQAYSLLQLAPVHLVLKDNAIDQTHLSAILGHIRTLVSCELDQVESMDGMLGHPAAQHLICVKTDYDSSLHGLELLPTLPGLTSLSLDMQMTYSPYFDKLLKKVLPLLLTRPRFTELILSRTKSDYSSIVLPLAQTPGHLRRLHLNCNLFIHLSLRYPPVPPVSPDIFEAFASFGHVQPHLEVLSLAHLHGKVFSPGHIQRFFASLGALHTLQLILCPHIDMLLAMLPGILHLQRLLIYYTPSSIPSASSIHTLKAAMPQLCITSQMWNYQNSHGAVLLDAGDYV